MARYFLRLSFDGTAYNGWQIQENTPHTIQQVLTEKLSMVLGETIEITGAGRTDTGVHAKEIFAHFNSIKIASGKIPFSEESKQWIYKFNLVLPADISIKEILAVKEDAHARFSATARTYEYLITTKKDPFLINKAYYLFGELDIEKMNEAAEILKKYTDFSSFSKSKTQVKTNDCKIELAQWTKQDDLLIFKIKANRFLRNMVRAIVGTLIDIGNNKISVEDLKKIIENKNRSDAGFSVPAHGLYLIKVDYPNDII